MAHHHIHPHSIPGIDEPTARKGLRHLATLACLLSLLACAADAFAAARYAKQVDDQEIVIVVPDRHDGPLPLVIALHGCDQGAETFLEATGLEKLVDAQEVVLALPEADTSGDNPLGCWRWWDPDNQRREGREPRRITALVDAMDVPVDRQRVYALGLSAGGAMAMILGTVYPDVFAAVGVHSGVGFAAAANAACALKILGDAPERVDARGRLAYLHQPRQRIVPTMILHGRADDTVDPRHADGLVRELARRNDFIDDGNGANHSFDAEPDATLADPGPCRSDGEQSTCYTHELKRFEGRDGRVLLQQVMVDELGHAWSGGREGHRYADPAGPDAGAMLWRFFDRHRLETRELEPAESRRCRDWWGPPWWHFMWNRTMSFSEYACDMDPWSMVWRHRIEGVPGPGRCP